MCLIQELYHCQIKLDRFLILVQERDIALYTPRKGNYGATGNLKEEKNSRLLQIKKDIGAGDDEEDLIDLTDPVARKNSLLGKGEVELDFTVKDK